MVLTVMPRGYLYLGLGLLYFNLITASVQTQQLQKFAALGGLGPLADSVDDYTCTKTKGCAIGCCGAL